MPENLSHRFFGSHLAYKVIQDTLSVASLVRIATAYFEPSGYQNLQSALTNKEVRLLVGREEGGRDRVQDVIEEFVSQLSAHPLEGRTRAMRQLLEALENNQLAISVGVGSQDAVYLDSRYLYQHAKLYIADETDVVVTSANMSYHGLVTSREAGIRINQVDDVAYFVEQFDYFFDHAVSITEPLIEQLRAYLESYPPFTVYMRALLELYGLPEAEVPAQLPILAGYQRPIVSRVLRTLDELNGALLIASTGLGKTVMAAHVVAYLRMQNAIDRVMVISPAGLRETWRRFMRAAATSSAEFSYNTLSVEDARRDGELRRLEAELRDANERLLVVLDESHHLRNPDDKDGEFKPRYERIRKLVHRRNAKLLMLTATPFSRSIEDVNNQLELLPISIEASRGRGHLFESESSWKVDYASELSDLAPCSVLTTPSVVQQFSQEDENGERYVLFAGDQRRYFPRRLYLRSITCENPFDDVLIELLDSGLLNQPEKKATPQPSLFEDFDSTPGRKAGAFNAEVMRQFCSSPVQVSNLFGKLKKEGSFEKVRFVAQNELTNFVNRYQSRIDHQWNSQRDSKLKLVVEIVRAAGDAKIVIFCHYIETAKALAQILEKQGIRAATTADKDPIEIETLLRSFAPIANDVPEEERGDELQVLIATGALAEGFNLQDASILINYDLPWTVLTLAQRMGRILRPWFEPREITIYNLIPSTMSDSRILMAMNWQRRLVDRGQQHTSFADIPVFMESRNLSGDEGMEMAALAKQLQGLDQNLELDLDQVLDFIDNAQKLKTSSFLDDLWLLNEEQLEGISKLPPGIRSARAVRGKKRFLFVLFEYRKKRFATLFNASGHIEMDDERRDAIMQEIRCDQNEPIISVAQYPDDDTFDSWLEIARNNWAKRRDFDVQAIDILCSMALIPNSG